MRTCLLSRVVVGIGLALYPAVTFSQTSGGLSRNTLVDMLVWGADLAIDWTGYSPEVRAATERYQRRFESYRHERQPPAGSSVMKMVQAAWLRYERRLAAVSDDPMAQTLAAEFVERLKPCYEWEGYHDCPEREARFAAAYHAANPDGPFREYLPLLVAHRWVCTAEAYDYEERPEDAIRARREFESALSTARRSTALLVRIAAEELRTRGRCFSSQR